MTKIVNELRNRATHCEIAERVTKSLNLLRNRGTHCEILLHWHYSEIWRCGTTPKAELREARLTLNHHLIIAASTSSTDLYEWSVLSDHLYRTTTCPDLKLLSENDEEQKRRFSMIPSKAFQIEKKPTKSGFPHVFTLSSLKFKFLHHIFWHFFCFSYYIYVQNLFLFLYISLNLLNFFPEFSLSNFLN